MKNLSFFRTISIASALLLIPAHLLPAGPMGVSGGFDLDRLWAQAKEQFDPSEYDAVLLLESRHVAISTGGDLTTRVHRVVWIGTEHGIENHADLRIPYNSAVSTFTVTALRTWRDGTWWPHESEISETAVVETLPFAMARADDYTSMRETMLLHDGVELPCIMETAYEITERGGGGGSDGLFVFSRSDPAVLSEFVLAIPSGAPLRYVSGNGAPERAVMSDDGRTVIHTWRMENLGSLGAPHVADPAVYAPHVVWSTWDDWSTLGRKIVTSFDEAAVLDHAIADTLAEKIKHEPSLASKARKVVDLVNEYTRSIHYDSRFWQFSPRPAWRTWETAYGHCLDRAVLAAALFREAGLEAEPMLRSKGPGGIAHDVPGFAHFEEIAVFVSGGGLMAFYDPSIGTLHDGPRSLDHLIAWKPKTTDTPPVLPVLAGLKAENHFELILTLRAGEEETWTGTGFLHADGAYCPYDEMVGLRGEALSLIKEISSSALPGAAVTDYNPEVFEPSIVTAGFDFTWKPGDKDELGRIRLVTGDPAGAIIASLPSDIRLYHEDRGSPVVIAGNHSQRIRLRLDTAGHEIVYVPEARQIENEAGRCTLNVEQEDGWVTIDRSLTLKSATITPETWPLLRMLLLEEVEAANRTILIR